MLQHNLDFAVEVKRTLLQIVGWGIFTIVGAWITGYVFLILGLVVGNVASIIYFLLMGYRVRQSSLLPPAKAIASMRSGWLVRLSFVVLVLILSVRLPQISFGAAVLGLFSLQIVIFFNAVYFVGKNFRFRKETTLMKRG
ncbi:MAG TPA: ATP synthase subunit I [Patescibacteria group bacterium]|nr:ATP synthase subunit I [Patescibacteria group bacterium]